jgi:hypothetical protein
MVESSLFELSLTISTGFTVRVLLIITRSLKISEFSLHRLLVSLKHSEFRSTCMAFRSNHCEFRSILWNSGQSSASFAYRSLIFTSNKEKLTPKEPISRPFGSAFEDLFCYKNGSLFIPVTFSDILKKNDRCDNKGC